MRSTALIVSAAALIRVSAAEAQERGPLTDRFSIDAGMYSMDSDTTIRADSIDGIDVGSTLDLEDTFGFDEEMVFRLEGIWRFHKRHKLRLMYFDSKRTAHESIEQPISFAGEDFSIGLEVRTDFNFQILELAYEYAFLRRETYESALRWAFTMWISPLPSRRHCPPPDRRSRKRCGAKFRPTLHCR